MLGRGASPETIAALEEEFGINDPYYIQYLDWIFEVIRGDLGRSIVIASDQEVLPLIIRRLSITLTLALFAVVLAIALAVVAGTTAAIYHGKFPDFAATSGSMLGISMPNYWLGYMLIIIFAINLGILPTFDYVSPWEEPVTGFKHIIMPAFTLGLPISAVLARMLRSELLEHRNKLYIEVAHGFGLPRRTVSVQYWFRNSLIPVITVLGNQMRYLLGGAVIIEEVFGIPGTGRLLADAVFSFDFQLVQGVVLVFVIFVLSANLLVDITYAILDPRISY